LVNKEEAWNQVDKMEVAVVEISDKVKGKNEVIEYFRDHVQQRSLKWDKVYANFRKKLILEIVNRCQKGR